MSTQRIAGHLRPESTHLHANAVLQAALNGKHCTCEREVPAATHHKADCTYRLLVEAAQQLDTLTAVRAITLPEGWQIAPDQPTPEMLESTTGTKPGTPVADALRKSVMQCAAEDYASMLAHSPKPELELGVTVVPHVGASGS
jgi:hypothetical protein